METGEEEKSVGMPHLRHSPEMQEVLAAQTEKVSNSNSSFHLLPILTEAPGLHGSCGNMGKAGHKPLQSSPTLRRPHTSPRSTGRPRSSTPRLFY